MPGIPSRDGRDHVHLYNTCCCMSYPSYDSLFFFVAGPTLLMFGTGALVYLSGEVRMDDWISFKTAPRVCVALLLEWWLVCLVGWWIAVQ